MTARALAARVARMEATAPPGGRVRVFALPRALTEAERDAWTAAQGSRLCRRDQVVLIKWLSPGERPADRCGEIGRRACDARA